MSPSGDQWEVAADRKALNYTQNLERSRAFADALLEQRIGAEGMLKRERERYARGEITLEQFERYLDGWLAKHP